MSIPTNQYTTVAADNFISRVYANLQGVDLFFYISVTNELRAKRVDNPNFHLLATGVTWVSTIPAADKVHLYYSDMLGTVYYAPFQNQNFVTGLNFTATGIGSAQNFSTVYAANATPPVYVMVVDDGVYHNLVVADDPAFSSIRTSTQVFDNVIDSDYYVTLPVAAIHPEDTNRITINCEKLKRADNTTQVGFYVVKIPGVV